METTSPKTGLLTCAYRLLIVGASYLQSPFLLAMRLYWGWQFHYTGWAKLTNHDKFTAAFQSFGVPLPSLSVYLAGSAEFFGGLLLLVGLGSRLASVPLIFTMIVAYLTAEIDLTKNIFSNPDKFVSAAPFLYMLTSIIVLVFGPGVFSLDWLISKKLGRKS